MKGITDIDEGTIRKIDWQELLPGTMLVRSFSLSLKISLIVLFSLFLSGWMLLINQADGGSENVRVFSRFFELNQPFTTELSDVFIVSPPTSLSGNLIALFGFLILLFLWLMVARSTAVRLASTQRSGFFESFKFARKKYCSLLGTIFLYSFLIAVPALSWKLLSWIDVPCLQKICLPIMILLVFASVFMGAASFLSFPMSVAAIAAEKSDPFDAVSRGYSYLFQRPLHFIIYSTIAILFGAIGFVIFSLLSSAVLSLLPLSFSKADFAGHFWTPFWIRSLIVLPFGYLFVYFTVASTAIYFILRRSVDGTPWDNFKSDDSHKPSRKLRPIFYSDPEEKKE
ncbi:MAG: hypothetical protein Q4G69_11405 [Planctomycetia bacterium]|nr:hypothetical protein [Planctomycetia bacterium]